MKKNGYPIFREEKNVEQVEALSLPDTLEAYVTGNGTEKVGGGFKYRKGSEDDKEGGDKEPRSRTWRKTSTKHGWSLRKAVR